jgi:Protein phosphatase 2C
MGSQRGAGDSWWDEVYTGPRDDLPDTPRADSRRGTVDDWFDTVSGLLGTDAGGDGSPEPGPGSGSSGDAPRDAPRDGTGDAPRDVAGDARSGDGSGSDWSDIDWIDADWPGGGPPTLVDDAPPRRAPSVPPIPPRPTRAPRPGRTEDVPAPPPPRTPPAADVPSAELPPLPSRADRAPRQPLPPLPVRPPRIPPLRPDPRLSPPAAPEPVPVPAPGPATEPEPVGAGAAGAAAEPADAVREPAPPWPEWPGKSGDSAVVEPPAAVEPATVAVPPDAGAPPADGLLAEATGPASASGPATPAESVVTAPLPHVGERPPTYDPEPTALPAADPELLAALVPDTVLDGARYGTMTLRAASVRGDSARYRGDNRADRLLTARFGEGADALLVVVIATPSPFDTPATAEDACRQLAAAVGRSRTGLLGDLRTGAQENLRYGLQRLTARATVRLRGAETETENSGALHALIAPLDPTSRLRAGFGVGPGALLLLGDGAWYDAYAGRRLVQRQQPSAAGAKPDDGRFRFRVVVPEPGDVLLMCSDGLAQPLREEPAVSDFLADHWAHPHPPGMVDYLRHVQVRAKGYAADRTAAAVWED